MPTRELLLAEALNMFPSTISLDDIVDVAYQLLGEAVGALLIVPPRWAPAAATPKPEHASAAARRIRGPNSL
jgi:hypothetical protein